MRITAPRSAGLLQLLIPLIRAQASTAELQSVGFNSTFSLSAAQVAAANLSDATAASLDNVIRFDRSQLANGGPAEDDFYTLPPLPVSNDSSSTTTAGSSLEPGVLLKVQAFTDPAPFTLPPNTALSRILYTTTNLNGTVIPASAFVLWPFQARQFSSSSGNTSSSSNPAAAAAPAILWTHGTSGFFASAAPSSHRALWYGDAAPFALALAGYAVVAPDYAGLGVSTSWDGSAIPHQYLISSTSARDALFAMRAARDAFAGLLTDDFVVVGHSQGGGVAWGVAEALVDDGDGEDDFEFADLRDGYLGTVAGSPTTDAMSGVPEFILPWVSMFLKGIFPTFEQDDWITPLAIARTQLLREIEGSISASEQLFFTDVIIQDGYNATWYVDAYSRLANAGRKPTRGPLLVVQGTADVYVPYDVTTATVRDTCASFPESDLEYVTVNGTGHVPTLDATRQVWLRWIEERFRRDPVTKTGCFDSPVDSFLPIERYQAAGNAFLQWAGADEFSYETPLGP
ncbi:alpha/beta-hydrolase [Xylariomycetidae sp. FL2044]|nr:alpha/beta-hydrolase [Xylariomycetidae sp. FL2044]